MRLSSVRGYKAAKWISTDVRDLIRKVLETDPKKRFTMADIRKHPWYTAVPDSAIPKDTISPADGEAVKEEVLRVLNETGADTQAVLDAVASQGMGVHRISLKYLCAM
jgi:serine/threonine protein kinase